jgi:uncharacterized protein YeaO (DUF488 family)
MAVFTKRAYERPAAADGARVLVDRLWPRGVRKSQARIEAWLRDLAPSSSLRLWFHRRPQHFGAFRKRYLKELSTPAASAALEKLYAMQRKHPVITLIYASKNEEQNNATVLKELLEGMRKPPSSSGPARAVAARARMPRR